MKFDPHHGLGAILSACYQLREDSIFRLSSGGKSVEYVDVKYALMQRDGLHLACQWVTEQLYPDQGHWYSYLGGPSIPAAVIVGALLYDAAQEGIDLSGFVVRERPKGHGTEKVIEGVIPPRGSRVLLVEDVITTGQSVLTAARVIEKTGCHVGAICALVDRQAGGVEILESHGYPVRVFTTLAQLRGA